MMNKTALITGASSGIGKAYAEEFARTNHNLVLVARSKGKLENIRKKLIEMNKIKVYIISMDLSREFAGKYLYEAVKKKGLSVDILVNNSSEC